MLLCLCKHVRACSVHASWLLLLRQRTRAKPLAALDLMILKRLAGHASAKEIAEEVGLSLSGVYKARARLASRLATNNREGFAAAAASYGLIQAVPAGPGFTPAKP